MESKTGKNFQGICKKDIDEIKRLMNPPQLVKDELTTTVLLLGYTETQAKVLLIYFLSLTGRRFDRK